MKVLKCQQYAYIIIEKKRGITMDIYEQLSDLLTRLDNKVNEIREKMDSIEAIQFKIAEIKGYVLSDEEKESIKQAEKFLEYIW
jgi:DNA repair ATPase RecN